MTMHGWSIVVWWEGENYAGIMTGEYIVIVGIRKASGGQIKVKDN